MSYLTRVTHSRHSSSKTKNLKNGKLEELLTYLPFFTSHAPLSRNEICGWCEQKVCVKVQNNAVCTIGGRWDELSPEGFASIFVRIVPPELMVRSVALVFRSWTDIDMEEWCWRCRIANRSHLIDSVIRKIVRRSRSTFRRLSTYRLGDVGFSFTANGGRCLKILQIPE